MKQLESDRTPESSIKGSVDAGHATRAQATEDLEAFITLGRLLFDYLRRGTKLFEDLGRRRGEKTLRESLSRRQPAPRLAYDRLIRQWQGVEKSGPFRRLEACCLEHDFG